MLFIVVGTACNGQAQQQSPDANQTKDTTQVYGSSAIQLPRWVGGAQIIADNWAIFNDFEEELIALNTVALAELRSRTERLITFADSLSKTLPDTLKNQPITSRILVLDTRVKLLDQAAHSDRATDSVIHNCFLELNASLGNLKIQINEKLLKDRIDADRKENEATELKKQREILDSIAAAEGAN